MSKIKVAIWGSGTGSNAKNLIQYFKGSDHVEIAWILSNKPDALILQHAIDAEIPTRVIAKEERENCTALIEEHQKNGIDWIILAGYLWKIPAALCHAYPNKIVNIHPALLPKYGGKGMYGHFVHDAVHQAGEKESGITIHFVNEHYDEGNIIFQARCTIEQADGPAEIEKKVRALEIEHFPHVIAETIIA
ncbi:MAG: hypothetical protein RL609_1455 [Bacteroidota bacterium]|jgi:phosphoribosylglycinamide formyltransferase-1